MKHTQCVWAVLAGLMVHWGPSVVGGSNSSTAETYLVQAELAELAGEWAMAGNLLLKAAESGVKREQLGPSWCLGYVSDAAHFVKLRAWRNYVLSGSKEKLEGFLWSVAKQPGQATSSNRKPVYDQVAALAQLASLCDTPETQAAYEQFVLTKAKQEKANAGLWAALTWFYDRQGQLDEKKQLLGSAVGTFSHNWRTKKYQYALPAVYALSKLHTAPAARVLGEMLSGADEGAEAEAALAGFPPALVRPLLAGYARHDYHVVRWRAVNILVDALGPEGLNTLREWLKNPTPQLRISAIKGLRQAAAPDAFADIWPAVADGSPEVRGWAIRSLAEVAGEADQAFLNEKAEKGGPKEQLAAKVVLLARGDTRWAEDVAACKEPRQCVDLIAVTLADDPPAEIAPLLLRAASSSDRKIGSKAYSALAKCPSKEVILHLMKTASSRDSRNRGSARRAFAAVPRSSLPALLEVAVETKNRLALSRVARLLQPGDQAYAERILEVAAGDPQLTQYAIQALANTTTDTPEGAGYDRVRRFVNEAGNPAAVADVLGLLGDECQVALLPDILQRARRNKEEAQALHGLTSEAALAQAVTHELNTEATRIALADKLRQQPAEVAVPLLIALMRVGEMEVVRTAGLSLRGFAGRDLWTAEEAEKWWAEAEAGFQEAREQGFTPTRTVAIEGDADQVLGFSPDGQFLLLVDRSAGQLRMVGVQDPKLVVAHPCRPDYRWAVWGYAAGERFWIKSKREILLFRNGQLERTIDCPPFISSAVLIPQKDELWVGDPRRCSVTVHDLSGQREPQEVPLAPTIGRRYLYLSHVPGSDTVAASNRYARTGFLVGIESKSVVPAPDLTLPWQSFRPARHSRDGRHIWALRADRIVKIDAASGATVKQLLFRNLFPKQPPRVKHRAGGPVLRVGRTQLVGVSGRHVVTFLGARHLFVIDQATGKWVRCEASPSGTLRGAFLRPGTDELWLVGDGEAMVYELGNIHPQGSRVPIRSPR